jgi:hypothetical protein
MKNVLSFTAVFILFINIIHAQPNYQWARNLTPGANECLSVAADNSGNVYVCGFFRNTVDFDPGPGTVNLNAGSTDDIYFAKYNNLGEFQWVKSIGGTTGNDFAHKIILDDQNNIYLCGSYEGTVDFDPGPAIANLSNLGARDGFFAKYDSNGNYLWAKRIGGTSNDEINSMAVSPSGEVHIIGYFNGTVDFDPDPVQQLNYTSAGAEDVFFGRYDTNGNLVWAHRIGGTSNERGRDIAIDNSGNCAIIGEMGSVNVDFDVSAGVAGVSGKVFIAKYNSQAALIFAFGYGTGSATGGRVVDMDNSGNVYVGGEFNGALDFDPSASNYTITANYNDLFLAKYDPLGNFVYAGMIPSGNSDYFLDLHVNKVNGDTYIGTEIGGSTDMDFGPGVYSISAFYFAVFAKYDQYGNIQWAFPIGVGSGQNEDKGYAITEKNGTVYIGGLFWGGNADFDPGAAVVNLNATNKSSFFGAYTSCNNPPAQPGSISGNLSLCAMGTTVYTVPNDPDADSYTWSLPSGWSGTSSVNSINAMAGSNGGTISVTANNACGSSSPQTISVDVCSIVSNTLVNDNLCHNSCDASIIISPAGNCGPYSQLWNTGATTPQINNLCTGSYTVVISSANGCTMTENFAISNPLPINLSVSSDAPAICQGECVELNAVVFGGSGSVSIQWQHNGSTQANLTECPPQNTSFICIATDSNQCSQTDNVFVTVNPLPQAQIIVPLGPVCVTDNPFVVVQTSNSFQLSGPGAVGNTFDPSIAGIGIHQLQLAVTDANGCSNSATAPIEVTSCVGLANGSRDSHLLSPNPFTDVLILKSSTDALKTISLYQINGQLIKQWRSAEQSVMLDTHDIPSGMYQLRIENTGAVSNFKVVKLN